MKSGSSDWSYYNKEKIKPVNNSYILKDLEPNTPYQLKLSARNDIGTSKTDVLENPVTTLTKGKRMHLEFALTDQCAVLCSGCTIFSG